MTPGYARIVGVQAIIGCLAQAHTGGTWDLTEVRSSGITETRLIFAVGPIYPNEDGTVTDTRQHVTVTVTEGADPKEHRNWIPGMLRAWNGHTCLKGVPDRLHPLFSEPCRMCDKNAGKFCPAGLHLISALNSRGTCDRCEMMPHCDPDGECTVSEHWSNWNESTQAGYGHHRPEGGWPIKGAL